MAAMRECAKGLQNLGDTCYFNSVVQVLGSIEALRDHYIAMRKKRQPGTTTERSKTLTQELGDVLAKLWTGKQQSARPVGLIEKVQELPLFAEEGQQDAHEFLTSFLGALSSDAARAHRSATNIVTDLFQSMLLTETKCPRCGFVSQHKIFN